MFGRRLGSERLRMALVRASVGLIRIVVNYASAREARNMAGSQTQVLRQARSWQTKGGTGCMTDQLSDSLS